MLPRATPDGAFFYRVWKRTGLAETTSGDLALWYLENIVDEGHVFRGRLPEVRIGFRGGGVGFRRGVGGRGDRLESLSYTRDKWRPGPLLCSSGPYRFFFYASDRGEPRHVHIERENMAAKFWLNPVRLAQSGDFGRSELKRIMEIVQEHSSEFEQAWNDFFAN